MSKLSIDFGTSRTKVAYFHETRCEAVLWKVGRFENAYIPSLFYVKDDGTTLFGEDAAALLASDPASVVDRLKRRLGRKDIKVQKQRFAPEDLLSRLFESLRARATDELPIFSHKAPRDAVLTIPALMNDAEQNVLKRAAQKAGFESITIMPEPVSAARAWLSEVGGNDTHVVVLDCGGGTIDWACLKRDVEDFELVPKLPPGGNSRIGGEDVDDALVGLIQKSLGKRIKQDDLVSLKTTARNIKEHFSRTGIVAAAKYDGETVVLESSDIQRVMNNGFIDQVCSSFGPFLNKVRSALGVESPRVLLVGGSSQTAGLRGAIEKQLGCETSWWERSEFATVLGGVSPYERDSTTDQPKKSSIISVTPPAAIQSNVDAEATFDDLSRIARQALAGIEVDTKELDTIVSKSSHNIASTKNAFKLGVLGEVKAGKSTLVNALAGEVIAFTDVTEATPVVAVMAHGEERSASVVYKDGSRSDHTIEGATSLLSEKRTDDRWIGSVDHMEYYSPAEGLRGIEVWDTPGLGASEFKEEVANDFVDSVGGAIWVFEATLLGGATVIAPVMKLKHAGKKIVAVINRIDELDDEDQVPEAVEFLQDSLGEYVDAIVPLSAKRALSRSLNGEPDDYLSNFRRTIQSVILETAESDREDRIRRSIGNGALDIERELNKQNHILTDRLGLIRHLNFNLNAAKENVMSNVPGYITEASEKMYLSEERAVRSQLLHGGSRRQTDADGRSVDTAQLLADSIAKITDELNAGRDIPLKDAKRTVEAFEKETSLEVGWRTAADDVSRATEANWKKYCNDAIRVTAASVPKLTGSTQTQAIIVPEKNTQIQPASLPKTNTVLTDSESAGVSATVASASLLGVVAALSAAISWPIVLAAVPIGLFTSAMHGKKSAIPKEPTIGISHLMEIIEKIGIKKRAHLKMVLERELPAALEATIDNEISRMLVVAQKDIWGGQSETGLENANREMESAITSLHSLAQNTLSENEWRTIGFSLDRPIVIAPDESGQRLLGKLLSGAKDRIDLLVPDIDFSLAPLLRHLSASVTIRLLSTANSQDHDLVTDRVAKAFGSWKGNWEARTISNESGQRLPLTQTLLLTERDSLETSESLGDLEKSSVSFVDFSHGRMAAEREFASYWEGLTQKFGPLKVRRV